MYKTYVMYITVLVLRNHHQNFGGKLTKVGWWIVNNTHKIL